MKDAYYFSHDSNARNDQKIMALRMEFGVEGYGIYFMIIEILRENESYYLQIKDIPQLAFEFRCDLKTVESVINDYDLFVIENDKFTSESLINRMKAFEEKRLKRVVAGRKGGNATAMLQQKSSNATASKVKESKVKQIRVKESKVKESKEKNKKKDDFVDEKTSTSKKYSELIVFNAIKEKFLSWYIEMEENQTNSAYYFEAKDGKAIKNLIKKIEFKITDTGTHQVNDKNIILGFTHVLKNINDSWLRENISLTMLNSKFNEIFTKKNNGKGQISNLLHNIKEALGED